MDNVKCLGTESRLEDCPHVTQDDCNGGEGAGVICDTRDLSEVINSTCYELDVAYKHGEYLAMNETVGSVLGCQEHCQQTDNCTHFTYYPKLSR